MKKELLEMMAKLLVADSSEKNADEKMDLILSKLESMESATSNASHKDEHLLINEVCKLTRKSRVTIWNWNKKGLLKPIGKSGKNPLYLKSDVMEFLYNADKIAVVCSEK
ncbi:DNA-binding protein [Kaistella daneshvariae]|uniref:DNA-binding protein n=1 Tax=Kaistella daneshvariae TaxID=2487074 RepID=A0ABN5SZ46_9FLAO|nr:helix-turn-helix domain-containing protein [Kaistella daneshvariae]AZI66541.1 DNA-binding protein [Kaistella daneshvariae]